jgi:ribose transport system permease protein
METKEKAAAQTKADVGVQKMSLSTFLIRYNAIIILIVLIIVASILSPLFVSKTNIFTLLRQQVPYLIIAMGMLMVIITGGIDLSVCSVAAVSSIMVAYSMTKWGLAAGGLDTWAAIGIGVGVGAAFGALNGFLIARLRMPAFIVTLAMMYAGEGIAYIITKGNTLMLDNKSGGYADLVGFSTGTTVLGIPYAVIFALVIVVIFFFVMKYTTFGRMVYAIGSNESAVQLAGINSKKHLFFVYLLSGILCGIAGVIITARSGNASALTAGVDYNMSTIAGVVIGGASLMGGEGTVVMTVIGVFIIAVIGNIMNLINLASYPQMVVKAGVIILAVLLKSLSSKKHG